MFDKFEREYNPKIDFKMLYFVNPNKTTYYEIKGFREIFYKNEKPKDDDEKIFKRLIDFYNEAKSLKLTNSNLKYLIEKFTKIKNLSFNSINDTKDNLIKNNQLKEISKFLFNVLHHQEFGKYTTSVGIVIFNAYLFQNNYYPMIFRFCDLNWIYEKVKNYQNIIWFYTYLSQNIDFSKYYKQSYGYITKKELLNKISLIKNRLVEIYKVKKLWLYGSFAREEQSKYSDIDFFVEYSEEQDNNAVRIFLQEHLKRPINIFIEGHSYSLNDPYIEREVIIDVNQR